MVTILETVWNKTFEIENVDFGARAYYYLMTESVAYLGGGDTGQCRPFAQTQKNLNKKWPFNQKYPHSASSTSNLSPLALASPFTNPKYAFFVILLTDVPHLQQQACVGRLLFGAGYWDDAVEQSRVVNQ